MLILGDKGGVAWTQAGRAGGSVRLAGHAVDVAVAVAFVDIASGDIDRPHDECRAIAVAARAIDIRGNRNAGTGVVGIAAACHLGRSFRQAKPGGQHQSCCRCDTESNRVSEDAVQDG